MDTAISAAIRVRHAVAPRHRLDVGQRAGGAPRRPFAARLVAHGRRARPGLAPHDRTGRHQDSQPRPLHGPLLRPSLPQRLPPPRSGGQGLRQRRARRAVLRRRPLRADSGPPFPRRAPRSRRRRRARALGLASLAGGHTRLPARRRGEGVGGKPAPSRAALHRRADDGSPRRTREDGPSRQRPLDRLREPPASASSASGSARRTGSATPTARSTPRSAAPPASRARVRPSTCGTSPALRSPRRHCPKRSLPATARRSNRS